MCDAGPSLSQHCVNVACSLGLTGYIRLLYIREPSEHRVLNKYWVNASPRSATIAQHYKQHKFAERPVFALSKRFSYPVYMFIHKPILNKFELLVLALIFFALK